MSRKGMELIRELPVMKVRFMFTTSVVPDKDREVNNNRSTMDNGSENNDYL